MSEKLNNKKSLGEPGTVILDAVSKRFRKYTLKKQTYTTIKSTFIQRLFKSRYPKENHLQALEPLSISIAPGSALGVIGRNGSGKSTLLKLIAGIYQPDEGRVEVHGRISALIELGAGFHPDFTGRENIYLGGAMYGLSRKEVDALFDSIVAYAELEDCIDDPVRTYSSGMYMRLGFSLAIHTDPDILLVDEVLAVGDAAFVHRCKDTISEFKRQGKTLIFVTHDLSSVSKWCDEVIWLDQGKVRERGEPRYVIDRYLSKVNDAEKAELARANKLGHSEGGQPTPSKGSPERWGNKDVEITSVRMLGGDGKESWLFQADEKVVIEAEYRVNKVVDNLVFGVCLLRADGLELLATNTNLERVQFPKSIGTLEGETGVFRFTIDRISLVEESYYLDVAAHREDGLPFDYHHRLYKFSVRTREVAHGIYCPEHSWSFSHVADSEEQIDLAVGTGHV